MFKFEDLDCLRLVAMRTRFKVNQKKRDLEFLQGEIKSLEAEADGLERLLKDCGEVVTKSSTPDEKELSGGFMCRTDFEEELGCAEGGNTVYPSLENLKQHRQCVAECGIVRVSVNLEEVIEPGKLIS